jgi:catechol 2,3-dioxygenase-like lactoylglutathione lyase family enzyme
MKYICPLLTVTDISRSREFYEQILEQKVKYDFGEDVTFEGDFSIHLRTHYQQLIGDREIRGGGNAIELFFEHDDVDAIALRLKSHGVEFVHEVREQPWRQRVMRCYDPDRFIIEIGESMECTCYRLSKDGLTSGQIAQATGMEETFVQEAILQYTK